MALDPNWLTAFFTVVLAFIAAIQAGFFYRQLSMMKKSLVNSMVAAEAAGKVADAAKRSADIATNTERAWLTSK